jgi:hypothetical protein
MRSALIPGESGEKTVMMGLLIRVLDKYLEIISWAVVIVLLTGGGVCAVYHLAWGALLLGFMAGFAGASFLCLLLLWHQNKQIGIPVS